MKTKKYWFFTIGYLLIVLIFSIILLIKYSQLNSKIREFGLGEDQITLRLSLRYLFGLFVISNTLITLIFPIYNSCVLFFYNHKTTKKNLNNRLINLIYLVSMVSGFILFICYLNQINPIVLRILWVASSTIFPSGIIVVSRVLINR
jgi:hypothetical protein